ncbi:MAG TPA: pyridoxal phosphate-dependent aminotransferase [Bryobacteraceae bacterium]|nr:pyridoxal phosphate-dependent aminotransferase [Bryobacteraceae bacterium]
MPATVSSSALAVPHSRIRELAEIAMGMDGVFKLYFGESNVPTPDFIKRAAQKAMADGFTFYTENAGLPSLRKSLARYYAELHAVELDPSSEIAITASGVQALNVAIRCLLDPGDEGIVLTPSWPNGSAIIQMANCTPREIPYVLDRGRYAIDFDALERAVTPRTKLLLYTSPSNPLGSVATEDEQQRLLDFTRRHGLWLMADEVYERLYYPAITAAAAPKGVPSGAAPSILKKCNRGDAVVVIQSFSKAYCMTGWRLGWMVGRKDLIGRASQLNEFTVSCASGFAQKAAETALLWGEDLLRQMVCKLRENRDFCLGVLSKVNGVTIPVPDGAFYLFAKVDGVTDSYEFCKQLLMETKVGLAPGVAFGAGGEGNVRICYASDRPILEEAMARVKLFLESRR